MRIDGTCTSTPFTSTPDEAPAAGGGAAPAPGGAAAPSPAAVDVGALVRWMAGALGWGGDGLEGAPEIPGFAAIPPDGAGAAAGAGSVAGDCPMPELTAGERILAGARELFASPETRLAFARASRYLSLNPEITGQYGGQAKGNVFAGDVLHKAGFDVPTYATRGWDGAEGKHYSYAERWPREAAFFDKVATLAEARPGDVLVADHLGRRGAGGAHVEVVTGVRLDAAGRPVLTTMGARTNGLVEDEKYGKKLASAAPAGDHFLLDLPDKPGQRTTSDTAFYVLRPKKPLE